MKRIITLLLILSPVLSMAQETHPQDTTFYIGNRKYVVKETNDNIRVKIFEEIAQGDTVTNDQIFEGVYKDGRSTEQRIALTIPFVTKKEKKFSRYFDQHVAGVYVGYSYAADGVNFSKADDINLHSPKTWEWGINLFEGSFRVARNIGLTSGLGFGYNSYRLKGNYGFEEIDGVTGIHPSPEEVDYRRSRLRYYHLRMPLAVEWQKRVGGGRGPIFFSFGPEIETRFWIRSKAIIDDDKHTLSKGLNVRRLSANLVAQAGYGDWGFYCRYATASLFESGKGPKMYPYSLGIQWFW